MKNSPVKKSCIACSVLGILLIASVSNINAAWVNVTSNLAGASADWGVHYLTAVPGKNKVIAGVSRNGLWASTDGGAAWTKLGTGAGSAAFDHRTTCIVFDPTNSDIFWESGIYGGTFGVYKTTDGGITLQSLGTIRPCDNVSVDFSDPERKVLLATGHEAQNILYRSTDAGQNWLQIGANMPAGVSFSRALVVNTNTFLVACAGYSGTQGMYRSTDGGATFASVGGTVTANGPCEDPLVLADGSIAWSLIYNRGILRTTDQGATWRTICGYGNIITNTPIRMPDGRFAGLSPTNIIMASPSGMTWTAISTALSAAPNGIVFEPVRGAFYTWRNGSGNVSSNAINRFDYTVGVTKPVVNQGQNRLRQGSAAIVAGLHSSKPLQGETYDLQGVAIRDGARMKTAGIAVLKKGM